MFVALAAALAVAEAPVCPAELAALPWAEIRVKRQEAWRLEPLDLNHVRDLLACEIAAGRSLTRTRPADGLGTLCDAISTDFHICNEQRPEFGCAAATMASFVDEGCLNDPYQQTRYHHIQGMYWRRRFDFVQAKLHLDAATHSVYLLLLAKLLAPGARPDVPLTLLVLTAAIHLGERTELSALLRDAPAIERHVGELERLMPILVWSARPRPLAQLRNQVGWSLLIARLAGLSTPDPTPWLSAAEQAYTTGSDRSTSAADNTRINLALAALQPPRRLTEARDWLAAITREEALSAEERLWLDFVRIRITSAFGLPQQALALQEAMLTRPSANTVPMAQWYAALARGELLEATDPDAALDAYLAAESELEAHARASPTAAYGPLADGRFMVFASATRRAIDLLHDRDPERAAGLARRARSRATRMATRDRCQSSRAPHEMPPPPPGELRILYTRTSERTDTSTWVGFAITADSVVSRKITLASVPEDLHMRPDTALAAWSAALLAPFADAIDGADRLVVLPTEELHRVPFHALPWKDELLVHALPVAYGLDWPGCTRPPGDRPPHLLVLAGQDPRLTAESAAIVDLLRGAGQAVSLTTVKAADDLAVLSSPAFTAVHIAAHGLHIAGDRLLGSDDRLQFGPDLWLTRDQILADPQVPELVFLSACQSSFVDAETLGGGVSVAHAFLIAGARFVVGSTHDLDDPVASIFAQRFHQTLARDTLSDPLEAWRAAYLSARVELAPSQHSSLRILRLYTP